MHPKVLEVSFRDRRSSFAESHPLQDSKSFGKMEVKRCDESPVP